MLAFSQFLVRVFNRQTNVETDKPLDIVVEVDDKNDNAPEFQGQLQFTVEENSNIGE